MTPSETDGAGRDDSGGRPPPGARLWLTAFRTLIVICSLCSLGMLAWGVVVVEDLRRSLGEMKSASAKPGIRVTGTVPVMRVPRRASPDAPLTRCAHALPAQALTLGDVEAWRDGPREDDGHVARWNRVLRALDPFVGQGAPMTAAEARERAGRGWPAESGSAWPRWDRTWSTLQALEQCSAAGEAVPGAAACADRAARPGLVETVRHYYEMNRDRPDRGHGRNWFRVLVAFGVEPPEDGLPPYTAQEARESETIWAGWRPVREELERLEVLASRCGNAEGAAQGSGAASSSSGGAKSP